MEALRIYKKPEKGVLKIELPKDFSENEEVEIIILPGGKKNRNSRKQFRPSDFFGIWSHKNIDVDAVASEMRDEWNRDF